MLTPEQSSSLRSIGFINAFDLLNEPEPSEEETLNAEYEFRRGYVAALRHTSVMVFDLYRAGYLRPQEISNIIDHFANTTARTWLHSVGSKPTPNNLRSNTPRLKISTWSDIRKRILKMRPLPKSVDTAKWKESRRTTRKPADSALDYGDDSPGSSVSSGSPGSSEQPPVPPV